MSTLFNQIEHEQPLRTKIEYYPPITDKLKNVFKKHNTTLVHSSSANLKNLLGSTKDKVPPEQRSGIYRVQCKTCDKCYIGQSSRRVEVRFKEHLANIRLNKPEKSSVAQHILENINHVIDKNCLNLLKSVNDYRKLDAFESLFIFKEPNDILNKDNGPIESNLFNVCST